MSKWISIIPDEYFSKDKKKEFLMWLFQLPCDIYTKKYILLGWAQAVGVAVTEKDVRFITAGQEAMTRG